MTLQIEDLKQFIWSIKTKKLNQINLKHKNLEILINKHFLYNHFFNNINEPNNANNNNKEKFSKLRILDNTNNQTKNNDIQKHEESEIYSTIISPMVGTFYRSPAPNEPPFIKKNDTVYKKQTVCIIEAMKLMNEIESEVQGEVIDILVNDGDIVDCGQALIKVKINSN